MWPNRERYRWPAHSLPQTMTRSPQLGPTYPSTSRSLQPTIILSHRSSTATTPIWCRQCHFCHHRKTRRTINKRWQVSPTGGAGVTGQFRPSWEGQSGPTVCWTSLICLFVARVSDLSLSVFFIESLFVDGAASHLSFLWEFRRSTQTYPVLNLLTVIASFDLSLSVLSSNTHAGRFARVTYLSLWMLELWVIGQLCWSWEDQFGPVEYCTSLLL